MKLKFCPGCSGELIKYQAAVECTACGARWFIIHTSTNNKKAKENQP